MGEEHGALALVPHRVDVRKTFDRIAAVLGEAFHEVLERVSHRVPTGPGTLLADYTLEVDKPVLPDGVHVYGPAVVGPAELSHERPLPDPVQDAGVAQPP